MNMKKRVRTILILLILLAGTTIAVLFFTQMNNTDSQEQAVKDALIWREAQVNIACGQAITPALHTDSGARYTFNDTCLPPGWEPDHQN